MDSFVTPKREGNELEVTGISRSGRVRKKSSKLMDFESSSNITESKVKKLKLQTTQDQIKKKKPEGQQSSSPVPQVTHTIHVAQIHHPPSNKISIPPPKKSPKLPPVTLQKKKKIESSSDYETQSQSTNSESDDDEADKKLHIAEYSTSKHNLSFDTLEPADDEIISIKKSTPTPKKVKKKVSPPKVLAKPTKPKEISPPKPKTRYTAYMLWSKEMRQQLLRESPSMDFTAISKRLGELWATVPNMEKYNWSNRAKRLSEKVNGLTPTKKFITKATPTKTLSPDFPKKKSEGLRQIDAKKVYPPQIVRSGKDAIRDPSKEMKIFRAIELQPIDVAAYLKLLGESLTVIGERLKEHNGQITVSGSLSVLLDSLLCALGSLICLTQQVPAIGTQNTNSLSKTLENIAYIMPGL